MSTNYYWKSAVCEKCGRQEDLHIGQFAMGWSFAVRIHPELGINTLDDWKQKWEEEGSCIVDEYGANISPNDLLDLITKPNGKLKNRRRVMVQPGDDPWDYLDQEFC